MKSKLNTPMAILIGSMLIAIAAYFGFRHSAPEISAHSPTTPQPTVVVSHAPAPSSPPIVPAEDPAQAAKQALEARRKVLVETCWTPSFAKNPEPPQATYTYEMTFDPTGVAIARSIGESREGARHDTGQCLRDLPMDLTIPPPGRNVRVEVELVLP